MLSRDFSCSMGTKFFFFFSLLSKIEGNNLALYNRSSRLLGLAMFAFAIEIFLQWLFDFRSWSAMYSHGIES